MNPLLIKYENALKLIAYGTPWDGGGAALDNIAIKEQIALDALNQLGRKSIKAEKAASPWIILESLNEPRIFCIAYMLKKQAILYKSDGIAIFALEDRSWEKRRNWLKELIESRPDWIQWEPLNSPQGEKWRRAFSRWRTLSRKKE